jgi:RNA polymerase sigma-70 factor (ECF subfamily)
MTSDSFGPDTIKYVYAIAMKYVRDEDAAWDVTQDALLSAFRHRDSFRGESAYTTWLYRIAATAALMYLRKQRRRSREVLASAAIDPDAHPALDVAASPAPTPEAMVAANEQVARVRAAVAALGDKYPPVFWMRYHDGYSETEIARRLGTSLPTVKTRAHRALVAARAKLAA